VENNSIKLKLYCHNVEFLFQKFLTRTSYPKICHLHYFEMAGTIIDRRCNRYKWTKERKLHRHTSSTRLIKGVL